MFTGIIESIGIVREIRQQGSNMTFVVQSEISNKLKVDQSVSHNGVCLTVEKCTNQTHEVTLIKETLDRSNLGNMKIDQQINLERCIRMSDRLDGHMVQGHVDCAVRCLDITDEDGSWVFRFELLKKFASLVVMKGSICINGISLTVSELQDDKFEVSIIPYTFEHTNMGQLSVNDLANIEFDILGKYVQRQIQHFAKKV